MIYQNGSYEGLLDVSQISLMIFRDELRRTWETGHTVFLAGNGGSAATASHIAQDMQKLLSSYPDRPKFKARSLCDNLSLVTALGNDVQYKNIFREQLSWMAEPGDLVILLSGSGNSENVLVAAQHCKNRGIKTVGLTGFKHGKLREMVDIDVHVPVCDMQKAEDAHMVILHWLVQELGGGCV